MAQEASHRTNTASSDQGGDEFSAGSLLLVELLRPWQTVLGQLLLIVEPLCSPSERLALRRRAAGLGVSAEPVAGRVRAQVDVDRQREERQ